MNMALTDQIIHSTVRIECELGEGKTSRATGFFYQFLRDDDANIHVPALVTNKHVLDDVKSWSFRITKSETGREPLIGNCVTFNFDSSEGWIPHPDPEVDLAIFPIAKSLRKAETKNFGLYYIALCSDNLPTRELTEALTAIEPILMVGYPIGLWDSKNNLPVVRRGITASPYYIDHEGRSEFLIDAACYPGSSGSPIFLLNESSYFKKDGHVTLGGRFSFLGILYAGPQYEASGEISIAKIPTTVVPISRTKIPINLGYCIKSSRLLDFEKIIDRLRSENASEPAATEAKADDSDQSYQGRMSN